MTRMDAASDFGAKVGYVMTHYPRVALTYIAGEIDQVERNGEQIVPIVMNLPIQEDLTTEKARERQRRSLYLKASALRVAAATISVIIAHPIKMGRLVFAAVRSARLDLGLAGRRLVHLSYATLAAKHCGEQGIRHLHAQFGLAPATIAWFACEILNFDRRTANTWSFTIHGFHDFVNETESRLDLKAASASFVICVSDFTKSQLCRVTDPRYWERFHVLRCGIDLPAFPLRSPLPLRKVPRIAIVGRLSPEKGHGILLDAVSKLAAQNVAVEVEIIGDGPSIEAIQRQAAELGIEKRVMFAGQLLPDEVSRHLSQADVFCMASFAEGLPISIMEAMAVGVPVVTTWIGGIPELAINGVTALTVPPGNSEALAEAIKHLIADKSLRERLVVAARAAVERMHSREANGAQLAEMYRTLLRSKVPA
jgi:colanic acid/amylovoran biosynthesis glycosyltransferase